MFKIISLFATQKVAQPNTTPTAPRKTEDLLAECGDFLGEMFHPEFKQLAFCSANRVAAFGQEVAHGHH